jgi:DNA-binding CsgD family transcriptional regulator
VVPSLPAARLELARRRQERQDLIALLRKLVIRQPGNLLRCRDLRRMLALHLGAVPRLTELGQAMSAVGAAYEKRERVRGWRGVALVASPDRARRHVVAAWEKKLAAEGLGLVKPEYNGNLGGASDRVQRREVRGLASELRRPAVWKAQQMAIRAQVSSALFSAARAYLWETRWDRFAPREREIWELWALEGMPVRDIGERMGVAKSTVQDAIARHKARAGLLGR